MSAAAILVVGASAAAGCGSSGSEASSSGSHKPGRANVAELLDQSPEQASLSWFLAINHKDKAAVVAHFERPASGHKKWANGDLASWANGDPSRWPAFSALQCKQVSRSATVASVRCDFKESQAPSVGNPDSFWTIYLHRQPDGRWLITDYGQP